MRGSAAHHPATRPHVSGYGFLLRRLEYALLYRDPSLAHPPARARAKSLALGCVLALLAVVGCATLALLRPQPGLGDARIVIGRESGALYVRVGEVWHPALNLASARLIAASNVNPRPVPEAELARTKRGPLLGIPGAPQAIGPSLGAGEAAWTICDAPTGTTVVVGPGVAASGGVRRLDSGQALLVAPVSGSPAYLLYGGLRAVVDLADAAVARTLRLEGRAPHPVSQNLLNSIPEAPAIRVPRIHGAGSLGRAGPSGFRVGSVLHITRGDGDEYYVVLDSGLQRIGRVAADLLRFGDSQGTANAVTVAPDVIRSVPIVDTLPVASFPDRAPTPADGVDTTVCATWARASAGGPSVVFSAGAGLPVPTDRAPVGLAQADGRGPAVDGVYLPPGRSAYVRGEGPVGNGPHAGTRYLVTDTGVRFAIHDDAAARSLGLQGEPAAAPWSVLATLPCGPELGQEKASVAWDTIVAAGPP